MANVRKIAAAVMLPMAVSLASPAEASATTNILSQSKTQNVSASSMTVQSDALSLSSNDNGSVIDLSKPYEVTLPEIVITPGSESKSLANTVLSAPSAVSNLSNALTLSDTGNQAFDNAVAMNGPQAMPKPYEVTLPEIVITPGSNNTELAQDIESAQAETLNAAGDIAMQSVENRSEANSLANFWNQQGGASMWMPSFMSSSSSSSSLSDALSMGDTSNQAFDNAVAMNGPQAMPKPYEVTLPEIVITPGSNNTELAQDIESF